MTKDQIVAHATKMLGKEHITISGGKYFVVFDKRTPDFELIPGFMLHDFMSRDKLDSHTMIDCRVLMFLHQINEIYPGQIKIKETFYTKKYRPVYKEDGPRTDFHEMGTALDIAPARFTAATFRELKKAVRKVVIMGGRYFFEDYIHIDSMGPSHKEVGRAITKKQKQGRAAIG